MAYNGGKNGSGVYQTIINWIPPHEFYIEAFLGSGAIINQKKLAPKMNIGIELNRSVIDKFVYKAGVTVVNDCAISYLNHFREKHYINVKEKTFIYCDPPYPKASRKSQKDIYQNEMTNEQHEQFLQIIKTIPANIAVSSYANGMYNEALKDWNYHDFTAMTRNGIATERLYMNYDKPKRLHDYNFLGDDFIERQRIKRKIHRHTLKLLCLPQLERQAIFEALGKVIY